ncbi:MAG TPA: aminoacetone oxidase family FAD-binding enzyme, partial [Clostridiales bacterium]|nr:aminoacetone oxidase family FAD-binding enzyme [Clostridiales bacterium]
GIPLKLSAFRPLDEAVITRGGVAVSQVHPSSMQSKLVSGLYFAGEVLDVDALTGGYNLQIAFSTGALAGHHAAQQSLT